MVKTNTPSESELMERAHRALRQRIAESPPSHPAAEPIKKHDYSSGPAPDTTARRERSLQTCHRYCLYERPRYARPEETGAYVPELSAALENDRNLTDGARRLARKWRKSSTGRTGRGASPKSPSRT